MKSGIVKKYVADRGFGFIKMENGKDIFFHIKNGKNVSARVGEPELSFRNAKCSCDPKEGDRIMFEIAQGQKGLVANPWCFAEDWERAEQEITSHPAVEVVITDPTLPHGDKTMRKESGHKNPYERHHNRIKDNTDGGKDWRKDL